MIGLARNNCPKIDFKDVDLLELNSTSKFDWIVSTGNVINYVHPDERCLFFKKAVNLLATNGLLYFDFDTRRDIEEFWPGQIRTEERDSFNFKAIYSYDVKQDVGIEKQYWSETKNSNRVFSEIHYIYPISAEEIGFDLRKEKFQEPIFCHPEDFTVVSEVSDFLMLGCIVRLMNE